MSNDDLPSDGKDKRPRVTLDLTAKEVKTAGNGEQTALPPPVSQQAGEDDRLGTENESTTPVPPHANITSRVSIAALVTHLMAGLAGGLLALVIGYVAVEEFGNRVSGNPPAAVMASMDALKQRLAALEKAGPATAAPDAALSADIKRANEQLASLASRVTRAEQRIAASAATPGAPAPAAEPLPAPEIDLKPMLEPIEARVTALETKVAEVSKHQASDRQTAAATALAVGFNNLRRAVASGKPYAAEFDVVQKLGAAEADISALAPSKATGAATATTLAQTLTPLAREAARIGEGKTGDSGVMSKLWSEARSVVHIRRTGLVEGDSNEAILARMEVRTKAGDIAAAVKEGKALKGEAAVILAPWLAQAGAKASADAALDRIEAKLLVSLKSEGTKQ